MWLAFSVHTYPPHRRFQDHHDLRTCVRPLTVLLDDSDRAANDAPEDAEICTREASTYATGNRVGQDASRYLVISGGGPRVVWATVSMAALGQARLQPFHCTYPRGASSIPRTSRLNICVQENALHDLPTATYPNQHEGATLACTRAQDSAAYTKFKIGFAALDRLTDLCASLPVHCIFGEAIDMV